MSKILQDYANVPRKPDCVNSQKEHAFTWNRVLTYSLREMSLS